MSAARFDVLQLAETGQADTVLRDLRVRALWAPYYFGQVVLGYTKLQPDLHLTDTEAFIERWANGELVQWIQWPRAFYKTTTYTITTSMWGVTPHNEDDARYAIEKLNIPESEWYRRMALHDQDATQLLAFETFPNACKKIKQVRWHYEENTLFRALFPEIAYQGNEKPWTDSHLKCRRVGERQREDEGTFEAIGVEGSLQSRHYTRMWLDDLVGEAGSQSQTVMDKTIGWYRRLFGALESAKASADFRVGISNRWGWADLNSWVMQNEPEVHFYTRSAIEIDPETGQEKSICPAILTLEDLDRLRRKMGRYDFYCQYMNRPFAPGNEEVDVNALHYYEVSREGVLTCSCGYKCRPSQLHRCMVYDPYNAKGASSRSCPAIAVLGIAANKHVFLLDYSLYKGSYNKVFDKIFEFNKRWRPHIFSYEDVGNQNMCEFYIKQHVKSSDYIGPAFPPIKASPTRGKGMEIRVRDSLFPVIRLGNFSIRRAHTKFVEMCQTFPTSSFEHDYDLLDACAQAPYVLKPPLTEEEWDGVATSDDENLQRLGVPYSHYEVRI